MSQAPRVGSRVGDYELVAPLGRGGMGTVFRARHVELDAPRALKLVDLGGSRGSVRAERFAREARVLAKLDRHPGIVRVHEHGTLPGGQHAYCVMELVEGQDLECALVGGPLAVQRLLELGLAVSRALAHVHAAGVVHRDLKPANVLLRAADGVPLLTDFGIARDEAEERLTLSQQVLGTAHYMAPEQAWGERGEVGPWSDVFSLGVLLYQAASGELPFEGSTFLEVGRSALAGEFVPLRKRRPEIPADLEQLVANCLRAEPRERPSAPEVVEALEALQRGERVTFARRARAQRPGLGWLVVAALLIVGGAAVAYTARGVAAQRAWEVRAALVREEVALERVAYEEEARRWRLGLGPRPDHSGLAQRVHELRDLVAEPGRSPPVDQELAGLRAELQEALELDQLLAAGLQASGVDSPSGSAPAGVDVGPRRLVVEAALLAHRSQDMARLLQRLEDAPEAVQDEVRLHAVGCALVAGELELAARLLAEARSLAGDALTREAVARLTAQLEVERALTEARALDAGAVARRLGHLAETDPDQARAGAARAAELVAELGEEGADGRRVLRVLDALRDGPWGAACLGSKAALTYVSAAAASAGSDLEEIVLHLRHATDIDPNVAIGEELAAAWLLQGRRLLGRGDPEASLDIMLRATRADTSWSVSDHELRALFELGLLDRAVERNPEDWSAIYLRGCALRSVASKREDKAERAELRGVALIDMQRVLALPDLPPLVYTEAVVEELRATEGLYPIADCMQRLEVRYQEGLADRRRLALIGTRWANDKDLPIAALWAERLVEWTHLRADQTANGTLPRGVRSLIVPEDYLAHAYQELFKAYRMARRLDDAAQALADLALQAPNYDRMPYRLAQLAAVRGNAEEARALLEDYLLTAPHDEPARETLEGLVSGESSDD